MVETMHELDPGVGIARRAEELGLMVSHHVLRDNVVTQRDYDKPMIISDVVCGPSEAGIFEPDELNEILQIITGITAEQAKLDMSRFTPSFYRFKHLEFPSATVVEKIGTYSVRSLLTAIGVEPRKKFEVVDVLAESRVKVFPSWRLAQERPAMTRLHPIDLKAALPRNDPERIAFKTAYKRNVPFSTRISTH